MDEKRREQARIAALEATLAARDEELAVLRAAISAAPITLFAFGAEGRFTLYEGGGVRLAGRRPGERVGQPIESFFKDLPGSAEATRAALDGTPTALSVELHGQSFEVTLEPVRDERGAVRCVAGVAINVSERKGVERALRVSDARFRGMIEKSTDTMWLTDAEGVVLYVSPGVRALLGLEPEEVIGKRSEDWIVPEDRAHVAASRATAPESGGTVTFRMMHADGVSRWIESSYTNRLHDPDIGAFIATMREVTARKRIEEALREKQEVMDRAQAVAHVGHWECALEATGSLLDQRISWSAECARIFGGSQEAPPTLRGFFDHVHPEDKETVLASSDAMFARGEPSVSLHRIRRADGAVRWMSAHAVLYRDEHGRAKRVVGVLQDVTEQQLAQRDLLAAETRLRQAQKMEAIGNLAGGVAHDFNNLLSVILSYSGSLLEELPSESPTRRDVEEIDRAATRAADLTRQLLAFSRNQVLASRPLDLDQIVQRMHRMLERLLGEHVTLVHRGGSERAHVFADPGQIEQVIMNLAVNARDAMPDGGTLFLETSDVTLGDEGFSRHDLPPGEYVRLTVTDTGKGMPEDVRTRVFEPFFTTKDEGGTGLGLATVFGIVKQSGGHIEVESQEGEGTRFDVYLPLCNAQISERARTVFPPGSFVGTETVLVVEDQDALRTLVSAALERHGYTVLEARDGLDALDRAAQRAEPIDLLVTDVVMPRMSGPELAARLLALRPALRVIFMSGFPRSHAVDDEITEHLYLQKPVTAARVLRSVREALDSPPPRRT